MKRLLIPALVGLMPLQPVMQAASSLPTVGTFTAGTGKISASGNLLTINQGSLKGIIDWNTFSIGKGSTVSVKNGSGATLNLVTGGTPSTLLGQLLATGSVFLLNPEGVLIGKGATVRTGGDFVASTLSLPAAQFLSTAPLLFSGSSGAAIVNLGSISSSGGNIYLIGRSVQNGGSISSPNGTSGIAAGGQVLISDSSGGQKVAVQAPGGDVTNTGFINAAQVELKSNGGNIYALAGNNGGQINAAGTANIAGHVWLIATNGTTTISSPISATNSNQQGGDVETSGARVNVGGAQIKTGKGGNWLLDPDDLTIDSTLAATIDSTLNGGTNVTEQTGSGNAGNGDIFVNSPIAWTTGADLTLSAFRNIQLNAGISNTGAGNLMLRADNTSTGTGTISGSGVIDFSGSSGYVSLLYNPTSYASPTNYSANFGSVHGGWAPPSDNSVSSQYTAYMLVNQPSDLANINNNINGVYALGQDIDASSLTSFVPIFASNYFNGIFDGMAHTISNLTINSNQYNIGLFGETNSSSIIRNLNMANEIIVANNNNGEIGGVVGYGEGNIYNASVTGAFHGGEDARYIGGIAGETYYGTISNSHTNVTIDAPTGDETGYMGGLVGETDYTTVDHSYATGSVTGSTLEGYSLGGLVGESGGAITYSWASGNITDPYGYASGGLVGDNQGVVDHSYATGNVTGVSGNDAAHGGLVGYAQNPITNSYATGNVVTTYGGYSGIQGDQGGLAGYSQDVVSNSYATGSVTSIFNANVGGLIGRAEGALISNTFATGAVSAGANSETGGLVGRAEYSYRPTTISVSYAMGPVSSGAGSKVGGLLGDLNSGTVTDTYSRGSVNGTDNTSYTGGLVGYIEASNTVTNSYSSGAVLSSGESTGGLVGNNAGTLATSYWDNQASGFSSVGVGIGSSTGTTGLTTAQLQSGVMPTGFNATNTVWAAPTIAYPYFGTWQGPLVQVAGNAYNGVSSLTSAGVGLLWNGSNIANTTTGSNGFYGFEVPQNMTTGGVLTYLTSGGVANSFSDGTGPEHFLEMQLTVGSAYIINAASTTLSGLTNSLGATIGNLTGPNFLYTVSNGLLNLNSGANLFFGSYPSFTFDRPLTTPGNITIEDLDGVTISNASPITAGSGNNITLAVGLENPDGAFTNDAGANALNVSGGGRWLVYSHSPSNDTTDGLTPAYIQYDANLLSAPGHSGDGLLYTIAPVITPSLTGTVSKTYDGTSAAALTPGNFAMSGVINGDTVALTTPTTGTYASANAGTGIGVIAAGVAIASAMNGSIPVYGYQVADSPATGNVGVINPATLTYIANPASTTYGAGNPAFSGMVTGFVNGQTISSATTGTAAFSSSATAASNVGNYAINGSGLTANNGNYIFTQADNNSSALTISPATLTYIANPVSLTYGTGNSAFSGAVTGFVNGQTLADATTGTAVFTSAANSYNAAGSYAINGSGLIADNGNYVFTQAPGNATALSITAAIAPPPTPSPTPTPTPAPTPVPTVLTFVIGNATGLQNSNTTFTATYTGSAVSGLNIVPILSGLTFTIMPAISGPGTYTITATGTAPAGYTLNIAPATLTIVGSTSAILPTQAPLILPVVPELLPMPDGNEATSLLQPLNSVGLFQVNVTGSGSSAAASFIGFTSQQTPLAQTGFFGTNDKKDTYSAGAKP